MVQQLRQDEPQYSCVACVESVTGNQDEEIVTFGVTALDALTKAGQLLADKYRCNEDEISMLLEPAQVESLSQWCSPSSNQS